MKKIMISIVTMFILISPALMNQELQSLSAKHHVSSSSANFEFVEMAHNSIQIVKNDGGIGDLDRLTITDSVMDDDGSTYVSGYFQLEDLFFGQMIVDLGRGNSADGVSPIVAKFNSEGEWLWFYTPVPKQGTHCDVTDSITDVDDAQGTANAIALQKGDSKLAITGSFSGCYDATNSEIMYDRDNAHNGYVALLNTDDGTLDWVAPIEANPLTGSGELNLNSITFSTDGTKIFVGGSIKNSEVLSNFSGGPNLYGDLAGDAYLSVLSSEDGTQEHHIDSCSSNDAQSSPCNNNGFENIATIDILGEELVVGIQVQSSATSISLFDSESATHGSGTDSAYAWKFELSASYPSANSGSPQSFGLDTAQYQKIVTSYNTGDDVLFLIDGLTDQDAAIGSIKEDSSIIFKGVPTIDRLDPLGIIGVENSDSILVIEAKSTDTFSIEDQDGSVIRSITFPNHSGVMMISMDADYSRVMEYTGLRAWDSFTQVSSNGEFASLVGLETRHKGVVLAADNDLDDIPNYLDMHINVNAGDDRDNDGILDSNDNCPSRWNVQQSDADNDQIGDVCDTDIDGDGVTNSIPLDLSHSSNIDMCPFTAANSSKDTDGDGCDDDSDADGIPDYLDLCPGSDDAIDVDNDGIIDGCDLYPGDTDNDGVANLTDNCIFIYNPDQSNLDGDLQGDVCDGDIDGDGITNTVPLDVENPANLDKCPYLNVIGFDDDDGDGCIDQVTYANNTNNDTDNDGILNEFDICPNGDDSLDADNDQTPDACDYDIDGDGVNNSLPVELNNSDNFDRCPYVDATGMDDDRDGCIDEVEPVECEVCKEPVKGNETNTLLDPDDVETVVVVGGTGAIGGGALALLLSKLRRASRFIGIDDGLEALKHLPKRKKEDAGSDHYFQRGLVRQREMTLSADKNLDDYIEENEKEGVEKK